MITGRRNYADSSERLVGDFVSRPEKVSELRYGMPILLDGIILGTFTGKNLANYIDDLNEADDENMSEYANARRSVNGTDRQVEIGQLALKYEKATNRTNFINYGDIPDVIRASTPLSTIVYGSRGKRPCGWWTIA